MDNNNLMHAIQQGFRVAIGATASCVETLQDPKKRVEAITDLQTELGQKTKEWSEKGAVTETEAKAFVNNFLNKRGWKSTSASSNNPSQTETSNSNYSTNDSELQELTAEIIALKAELEKLRKSKN